MSTTRLWLESQASADAALTVWYLVALLVACVLINIWIDS